MACYDLEWNLLPFTSGPPKIDKAIPRPEKLEEMLRLAKILSEGFCHVRVDLYQLNDGSIKFGEMTFTTNSGIVPWDPPEYDLIFGEKLTLPK